MKDKSKPPAECLQLGTSQLGMGAWTASIETCLGPFEILFQPLKLHADLDTELRHAGFESLRLHPSTDASDRPFVDEASQFQSSGRGLCSRSFIQVTFMSGYCSHYLSFGPLQAQASTDFNLATWAQAPANLREDALLHDFRHQPGYIHFYILFGQGPKACAKMHQHVETIL